MLSNRQLNLLDFIIREYINSAKPVGSALVSKKSGFKLSPATIRNEMNELEGMNLLSHLHTSGGRVPTDKAYRLFVEDLIRNSDLEPEAEHKRKIRYAIHNSADDIRELNKSVADVLSDISENLVITNIEESDDFYKTGLSSLFEMPEFKKIDKIFRLTSFFDEFDKIFNRIEKEFFGGHFGINLPDNFNIFIGRENSVSNIKDETVMCVKYNLPGQYIGSLTLIGPTRMDYEKNISLIKYATEELNKLAKSI